MKDLKEALFMSPTLKPIDYNLPALVILAIDTSVIAIGHILCREPYGFCLNITPFKRGNSLNPIKFKPSLNQIQTTKYSKYMQFYESQK
jgi:hypothetical protein